MDLRQMRALVAIVEEGSLSAAARRLQVSQPGLSQTVSALERELGVRLLIRSSSGMRATEHGRALCAEAREVLARYQQALARFDLSSNDACLLRLGHPLELPPELLTAPLAVLENEYPTTRVKSFHLSPAEQEAGLRRGELDVGLLRMRPSHQELDSQLVLEERLGVLLSAQQAARLSGPDGVPLEALVELDWAGFPRVNAPAYYDELTAVLRGYGLEVKHALPDARALIAEVKCALIAAGGAFAFLPPHLAEPLPPKLAWRPLVGHPVIRRTWAAWAAGSCRRDLGRFIAAFDGPSRNAAATRHDRVTDAPSSDNVLLMRRPLTTSGSAR